MCSRLQCPCLTTDVLHVLVFIFPWMKTTPFSSSMNRSDWRSNCASKVSLPMKRKHHLFVVILLSACMSIFKVKGGAFLSRTEPQNAQYFNNTFADASICLVVMSDIIVWLIVRLHISLNLLLWNSGFPTMCSHRFWMKVSLTSLSLSTTDENLNPRSKVLTFYSIYERRR